MHRRRQIGANAASFSYVLQAAHQRLPGVPGDGDVAAGERDGDPIKAFEHGIDPTGYCSTDSFFETKRAICSSSTRRRRFSARMVAQA
jgi:hypothetical protein